MHPPNPVAGLKTGLPVTGVGDEAATVFPGYPGRSGRLVVVAAAAVAVVVVVAAAVEAVNSQMKKAQLNCLKNFARDWSKHVT